MSENVYNILQVGSQGGTTAAPGAAAAAKWLFPISSPVAFDLDLGATYPQLDRGRNVRNLKGSGYHGVRAAALPSLPFEVRFEDIIEILEQIYSHVATPTGAGPYVWAYPFEAGTPSIVPATWEGGNTDASQAQQRLVSGLIDSLTLGFSAVTAGQASPWTGSASVVAFDRETNALTGSLAPVADPIETVQGHLTRLYEGTTATAYASLGELAGTLKSFTMTASRSLVRRAYGSASDKATGFGFSALSNVTYQMQVAISASTKTDFHDAWNTSGGTSLGERRLRLKTLGSGSRVFMIDALAGLFAIPLGDDNGERLYQVTGEFADDTTLAASHLITVTNGLATHPA